jgi:hypothetical protein
MSVVRNIVRDVVRGVVNPVDGRLFSWSQYWASQIVSLSVDYTATQFEIVFKLPSTKSVTFYWGNGTSEEVTGQDDTLITKTSSYSGAGTYKFCISGDDTELTYIDISGQAFVSGDVSSWSALTSLAYLRCNSTNVSGDVSSWSALTSLAYLHCSYTNIEFNSTPVWSVDGSIIWMHNCLWTSTMVNNALASFAGGPVTNCTIDISGDNAIRTAASDADVATIETPANGNSLTVNE